MNTNNTIKKVGYLTALVIMIGGTIGAGIFYKSQSILTNSHNDFVLAIISWLVAAFGILCIGLALVEIASASKRDIGIVGWVRNFTNTNIGRFSCSYMLMIYYPFSILTLSIYSVNALEDAYHVATGQYLFTNGYQVAALSLGIVLWLTFFSWLSFKTTEKSQLFFTAIKFLPIVIFPVFAYIFSANGQAGEHLEIVKPENKGLLGTFKGLGIIASIPAILFAYDGFFTIASVRSNLKKPKTLPLIILSGLVVITSIYLYISIAFSIPNNNGSPEGILIIPKSLSIILYISIFLSVIGVVNGYTMATNRVYIIATNDREFYFLSWMYKKFNKISKRDVSYIFLVGFIIFLFVIITPFTEHIWKLPTKYNHSLYAMSDVLTNYTSLFVFVLIGFAIFGGLINRKTNKIKVEKFKLFIPAAILSIIFLIIGSTYFLLEPLISLAFLEKIEDKLSNIYTFIVMIITIIISIINMLFEMHFDKTKHGNTIKSKYFPDNYISINCLIENSLASKYEKEIAYKDFNEEGWIKIKKKIKKIK